MPPTRGISCLSLVLYGIRIGVCTVGGGEDAPCLLADGWMALLVQGEEEEQERAGAN